MAHSFYLLVTKTEYTLFGQNLDKRERWNHSINRMNKCVNPEIVRHDTTLLKKEFKTGKAAWNYATLEFIDSLGVVYDDHGIIGSDYAEYMVTVVRDDSEELVNK